MAKKQTPQAPTSQTQTRERVALHTARRKAKGDTRHTVWMTHQTRVALHNMGLGSIDELLEIAANVGGTEQLRELLRPMYERHYQNVSDNAVSTNAPTPDPTDPNAVPRDQQQTIRVCGKQFWPPSEYCKMTYSQVWGVALYVKLTYMQMVHAGHESPESVIVHMMQSARALRLGNREFGSMYHNILSSMMGRVAQIEDPELTQWPSNGTGKPPEYEA